MTAPPLEAWDRYYDAPARLAGCSCVSEDDLCVLGGTLPATDTRPAGSCPCECHMIEPPGAPCRYCGNPVPMDGTACGRCWQPATQSHLDLLRPRRKRWWQR